MSDSFDPRTTPWSIDPADFYELESFSEQMTFLLRYAVLAPSVNNVQPWSFRVGKGEVEVYADYSRRMPAVDPNDRELLLSVGAAIMNFRVAAARFGYETTVLYQRRPEESLPAATIALRETCASDARLVTLFPSITRRRTNRRPFDARPIAPELVSGLCDVIDEYPDNFRAVMPYEKQRLAGLVRRADEFQLKRAAYREEAAEWIRPNSGSTDGICSDGLGWPEMFPSAASWLIRHEQFSSLRTRRDQDLATSASAFLVLTAPDDQVSLLQAGEALEHMLLAITAMGLDYSFLNTPVEVDSLRDRIDTLVGSQIPAQVVIRVGYGPAVGKHMPRRPVENVVDRVTGNG